MDYNSKHEKKLLDYALTLGVRPSAIAKHLGIHRSHVHRWMNGSRPVPTRYCAHLMGLIAEILPCYIAKLYAQAQGTSEEGLKAEEERARSLAQLQELFLTREFDKVLENATRAFNMLKDLPQDALDTRVALPLIAFCANALLAYTNLVDSVSPLADFFKKGVPDADRDREPTELECDGPPRAVDQ